MESVFADLKAQYELCADASIRPVLVRQMTELRGKIESAIADFYANGDAFVSQTTSMNQAIGSGQMSFSSKDGTEAQNGARCRPSTRRWRAAQAAAPPCSSTRTAGPRR